MASTLGVHNPLRYRGYVYDQEYGLYYLQSRYYNPAMGRFISADAFAATGQGLLGNNMFAYCKYNPIIHSDPFGTVALLAALGIVATGGIIGAALGVFSALSTGGNVLESAAEGFMNGMIGSAFGLATITGNTFALTIIGGAASALVDIATQATSQYYETGNISLGDIDFGRSIKTGVETGVGILVPALGDAANAANAIGTAVAWAESSTLIASADVIISNILSRPEEKALPMSRRNLSGTSGQFQMFVLD